MGDRTVPGSFPKQAATSGRTPCVDVGRVQPHLDVKIVGQHGELPARAAGELCTRGYSVISALDDVAKTQEAIAADGAAPRDLATIDEAGYAARGRINDMGSARRERLPSARDRGFLVQTGSGDFRRRFQSSRAD